MQAYVRIMFDHDTKTIEDPTCCQTYACKKRLIVATALCMGVSLLPCPSVWRTMNPGTEKLQTLGFAWSMREPKQP